MQSRDKKYGKKYKENAIITHCSWKINLSRQNNSKMWRLNKGEMKEQVLDSMDIEEDAALRLKHKPST